MKKKTTFTSCFRFWLLLTVFLGPTLSGVYSQAIGDVNENGTVDIVDALMIARYYVGLNPPGFNVILADVNGDNKADIIDALLVAQYYVCRGNCYLTPTPRPTDPPAATPSSEPTIAPRVDNPFAGASWYVEPDWSARASSGGGSALAGYNTAIWLDRISAITDGLGVQGHLDNALAQGANLIMFVVYNLPNRNCAAPGSSSWPPETGLMTRYKTEYIDPLAAIFANPAYRGIRIVCIIEPDSLPNLITNMSLARCQEAAGPGGYVEGIQYALDRFSAMANVYNYLDIATAGWLGWDSNFTPMADLLRRVVLGTVRGFDSVSGFISNTALYTPLKEPYLPDAKQNFGGKPLYSADFYEWNTYFSELEFALDMRTALIERGFSPSNGILIDTSRNGWGGPDRPTAASHSIDLNTFVNESRVDRRLHRGNWCNQPGGIGERPRAEPLDGIHAYVWAYPPGISDGISYPGPQDPYDPAKVFDLMCDPNGQSKYNSAYGTGAMDAPHRGRWNQLHFELLLQNAYPPL